MIDFTRAFNTAYDRTQVILFGPFDFGKWCAIGLSAFLAGFLQGGNGFNTSFNTNNFTKNATYNFSGTNLPAVDYNHINSSLKGLFTGMQMGLMVMFGVAAVVFVLAVILLVYWLGSRGQFMFLDNVVRNRGAISWPWDHYRRQANSLLALYIFFVVISFAIFLPILGIALIMGLPLLQHQRWPEGWQIVGFSALGLSYIAVVTVLGVVIFLFREFGVPIMFRQGILARPAFGQTMRLIGRNPGSVAIFVLLRIAIFIGIIVLSYIICCITCCAGWFPYIGTLFLLPVLVYVKCFTLECLAQFGPEVDPWTVDVPPVSPPLPPG